MVKDSGWFTSIQTTSFVVALTFGSYFDSKIDGSKVCISVVMTIKLSLPPRWLANAEPAPPSRCFTVFSAVFLGAVSWKLPLTSAHSLRQSKDSHLSRASFDPAWTHGESETSRVRDTARCPLRVHFPTRKRQSCLDSRNSLGTVLSETVATVSLSAPPTVVCSEQLVHSKTAWTILISKLPPVSD